MILFDIWKCLVLSLNTKSVTQYHNVSYHSLITCITKNMKDVLHKSDLSAFLIQIKQSELNKTYFVCIGQILAEKALIVR